MAYTLGYLLACVSPSVIVPSLIYMVELGYGRSKGIPIMMVAAGTFEDILAIIVNGIFQKVSFQDVGHEGENSSIVMVALSILFEVFVGLVVGICLGLVGWLFKFISKKSLRI